MSGVVFIPIIPTTNNHKHTEAVNRVTFTPVGLRKKHVCKSNIEKNNKKIINAPTP